MSWGWIGVDLDGTLAHYEGWKGSDHIGAPIPSMVARVKSWRADGREVRIFTARISSTTGPEDHALCEATIRAWCAEHLGEELPITATKDLAMIALYDDRCQPVETNTGRLLLNPEGIP